MVLGHVSHLVSKHAGELGLGLRSEQQAGVHPHESPGHRKSVDGVVAHHEEFEVLTRPGARSHNAPPDLVHVLGELRIVEKARFAQANFPHRLLADFAFEVRRQQRTGCVAQLRQGLSPCLRNQ